MPKRANIDWLESLIRQPGAGHNYALPGTVTNTPGMRTHGIKALPGTMVPGQQDSQQMIEAIVAALRQPTGTYNPTATPQQQQLASAQSPQGLQLSGQTSQALGQGLGNAWQNVATANRYNTTPFSQQTNMLAAQDKAFL